MSTIEITILDWFTGLFSLITVIIASIIGLIMILRYKKYKLKVLLLMGLAQIFIISPWWASSGSWILYVITGVPFNPTQYIFFTSWLVPFAGITMGWAISLLKAKEYQNVLIIIFSVIGVIAEVLLITFLIIDPSIHGYFISPFDVEFRGFLRYYLLFMILFIGTTGILIAIDSLKSSEPEIKLKGKFLIIAFISWTVGAIADAAVPTNFISLFIVRALLISSSIELYIGYIQPKWIKKVFIKE
ncbi:MAG: conserved membrane protein of unknown function [Promethearchaeota archaeon]|nr:MAG: conserved membrane protein of unknown function [Candidatus Lokiarchaeota archaeon]